MEGIRRVEWEDMIHETALNAAAEWRKWVEGPGQTKVSDEAEKGAYEKIFSRLLKEYPYEKSSSDTMRALVEYKPETVWRWVLNGTTDPRKEREALEASKFLPYLVGNSKDWTKAGASALQEMATNDLQYPYTKGGFAQFLRDLGKQQVAADRAKLVQEMRSMPQYWAAAAAYPSLVEAVDNAVANGEDIPDETVAKLAALDATTDLAQVGAPGLRGIIPFASRGANIGFDYAKNPYVNNAIGAGLQGVAEGVRQLGKGQVDPSLKPSALPVLTSVGLGMTRPGMVASTQAMASQFQGPTAQNFSRGIMRALRMGDPMDFEEQRIVRMAEMYNRMSRMSREGAGRIVKGNAGKQYRTGSATVIGTYGIPDGDEVLAAAKFGDYARALGVKAEADGTYDVGKLLSAYRKTPKQSVVWKPEGTAAVSEPLESGADNVLMLNPETKQLYQTLFPAKYSYESGASKARTAGLVLGKALGDYGGRIEPVIKGNPFSSSYNGNAKDYKDEAWYRKLSAESRKVIDEAFRKKAEEEGED